ncbi:hypothetical protein HMPREF0766_14370 [Sphingobacterium spiritivorum ATCC 33861]|uniref:Uncharacterized protein n=1 Tax=Sphingobacterium spiritivorum ATCC 33861 TaxID=525373 RepID=D7VTQ0_SPHSI|nr:hypothetical protein HMPREF0766_14370 [Sphingobacterium spiritivorum ATCC 33861]
MKAFSLFAIAVASIYVHLIAIGVFIITSALGAIVQSVSVVGTTSGTS